MNFSPYQSRGQLAAPNANYTDPLRVSYNNRGEQALARANAEMVGVLVKGYQDMKEQYDSGKVMEANNEYNRLMTEGSAELMQKKQENALNIVDDYDKLHVKALEKVRKKYGQFINYGKAGQAFNIYTERDNNTRRANMMKYQMAETDAYHETQFNNQLAECQNTAAQGGYSDLSIDAGMNRADGFIEERYAPYGKEMIEQQKRIFKGQIIGSALQMAINMGDYARMGEIANKYNDFLDPKTRVSVLSSLGKRQKEAHEFGQASAAIAALGLDAPFESYKQWVIDNMQGKDNLQRFYSFAGNHMGQEMRNGRNGCVEGGVLLTAPFFKFAADHADETNVGNIFRAAQQEGSGAHVERYHGGAVPWGAYLIYATPGDDITNPDNLEHLTVADGNGGYFGNSSGARDYEDENGNYVRGNGCLVHSDDQEIGGYEIAYVIHMDEQTQREMSNLEIEEQTNRIYELAQKERRKQTAQENLLIRQADDEMQDLMNHGVQDVSQYQAIADKYSYMNGVVNDHIRVQLEKTVATIERRNERAAEQAAKGVPSGKMDASLEEYLINRISTGQVKSKSAIIELCNELGITDPKEQKKCTKLFDNYLDNEGIFKISKDDFKTIEAYIPELEGAKGQAKAQMISTIRTLTYSEAKKYMAEHDGKMPTEIELAQLVSKAFTENVVTTGRTMEDSMFGSWFGKAITVSRADLAANGYANITYLGDGRYMLLKLNGVEADYKNQDEVLKMIGSAGYVQR